VQEQASGRPDGLAQGRRDERVGGAADDVRPDRAADELLAGTPVRVRALRFPDGDLAGELPSRDATLVVLAGAVDDSGDAARLVQVVDHVAVAGHAAAVLLVGADGPERAVEVWRVRVAIDRDHWVVSGAGCPASQWPRWDHLLVDSLGLSPRNAVVPVGSRPGPVEVVVQPAGAEPAGSEVQGEPGRTLGRLLAATGWDVTAPAQVPAAPDGAAFVDPHALDALLREGRLDALAGLTGPWAHALSRCAGAEVVRWRVGDVVVVDCGQQGLLRLGEETDPEGDGRVLVPVTGATRVTAFGLAASALAPQDTDQED